MKGTNGGSDAIVPVRRSIISNLRHPSEMIPGQIGRTRVALFLNDTDCRYNRLLEIVFGDGRRLPGDSYRSLSFHSAETIF